MSTLSGTRAVSDRAYLACQGWLLIAWVVVSPLAHVNSERHIRAVSDRAYLACQGWPLFVWVAFSRLPHVHWDWHTRAVSDQVCVASCGWPLSAWVIFSPLSHVHSNRRTRVGFDRAHLVYKGFTSLRSRSIWFVRDNVVLFKQYIHYASPRSPTACSCCVCYCYPDYWGWCCRLYFFAAYPQTHQTGNIPDRHTA